MAYNATKIGDRSRRVLTDVLDRDGWVDSQTAQPDAFSALPIRWNCPHPASTSVARRIYGRPDGSLLYRRSWLRGSVDTDSVPVL